MKAKCFLISPGWVKALTIIFPCPPSCRKCCGLVPKSSTAESEGLGCELLSFLFCFCDHHPSHGEPVSAALGSAGNPQEAGEDRRACSPERLLRGPCNCGKPRKKKRCESTEGSRAAGKPALLKPRPDCLTHFTPLSYFKFAASQSNRF